MNMILSLSITCTDHERPKTTPRNDHTEVLHQNKNTSRADFRLKPLIY